MVIRCPRLIKKKPYESTQQQYLKVNTLTKWNWLMFNVVWW